MAASATYGISNSPAYDIITTVTGDGGGGYGGDGGPATGAGLTWPAGSTMDAAGNLYIADQNNSRVRKVDPNGIITTVAGNGTPGYSGDGGVASSAELNDPSDVATDSSGNLYIVEYLGARVRKVSPGGIITTVAGNGTSGYSGDGGPATSAELSGPIGIAVDSAGNLYIADQYNNRIRMVNLNGTIVTVAGNGTSGFSGDGGAATGAKLNYPATIALDSSGSLYIADTNNSRVRKVSASGVISTVAGNGGFGYSGDGGAATIAELNNPAGLAMDSSGKPLHCRLD